MMMNDGFRVVCCRNRRIKNLGNVMADSDGKVMEIRNERFVSLFGKHNVIGKVTEVSLFLFTTTM